MTKTEIVKSLTPTLLQATKATLATFNDQHAHEDLYAFAFVAPAEGTHVCCAFATEQGLTKVVEHYVRLGYRAKQGDTLSLLRDELRWANPDDGWYYYFFSRSFDEQWGGRFQDGSSELFDGTTEDICVETLKQLDREGCFGKGQERESIAIGFTYGTDYGDFADFAELTNPTTVYSRIRREMEKGLGVYFHEIISSYGPT